MDAGRTPLPLYSQLLIKMYKFEKNSTFIKLGDFTEKDSNKSDNIISQALEIKKFLINKTYQEDAFIN